MVTQQFPVKQKDGATVSKRFTVDTAAVLQIRNGSGFDAARLERELGEMQQHFPRWILSVAKSGVLAKCPKCEGVIVFDRGTRCVVCEKPFAVGAAHEPAWFGLLPPIGIDGLENIKPSLIASPPPQHVVGTHASIGAYLLVPLVVPIPAGFPQTPPRVHYSPSIRRIRGMPQDDVSHAFHMLPLHQMCLFAGGEWHPEMSCRETLQQRAFAHVIKLLNYANGKKTAFAIVS